MEIVSANFFSLFKFLILISNKTEKIMNKFMSVLIAVLITVMFVQGSLMAKSSLGFEIEGLNGLVVNDASSSCVEAPRSFNLGMEEAYSDFVATYKHLRWLKKSIDDALQMDFGQCEAIHSRAIEVSKKHFDNVLFKARINFDVFAIAHLKGCETKLFEGLELYDKLSDEKVE